MNRNATSILTCATLASLATGSAMADYDLEFELDGPGGNSAVYVANLTGALDALDVAVDFTNLGGWTWAGDLWIGIVDPNGNAMQFGGYDYDDGSPNAGDFPSSWDSSTSGAYAHNASVAGMGLNGTGDWIITIVDGYSSGADTDRWDGVIGLEGLEAVPAPGALALLGLAGLARKRRRRAPVHS